MDDVLVQKHKFKYFIDNTKITMNQDVTYYTNIICGELNVVEWLECRTQ